MRVLLKSSDQQRSDSDVTQYALVCKASWSDSFPNPVGPSESKSIISFCPFPESEPNGICESPRLMLSTNALVLVGLAVDLKDAIGLGWTLIACLGLTGNIFLFVTQVRKFSLER